MNSKIHAILITLIMLASTSTLRAETLMLDTMESGVTAWTHAWGGGDNSIAQSSTAFEGTKALEHGVANYVQYAELVNASLRHDLSGYATIVVYARLSATPPANPESYKCAIRLRDADGEVWQQKNPVVLNTDYQRIEVPLKTVWEDPNGFELVENGVNWALNFANINKIGLFCQKPVVTGAGRKYFLFDALSLWKADAPSASLSVTPSQINFGTLLPAKQDHRFLSPYVTVEYSVSGYSTWQIEVYSTHTDGSEGLKGQAEPSKVLPLKAWYGRPQDAVPDPEIDADWGGLAAKFSFLTDEANSWHMKTAFAPGNETPSGFRLYFATDAAGGTVQDYSAPITIELKAP